ncbi:hypothetical protein AVEN_101802-1 [Araneus ventricosus]|uniref:Tc1-like transposase DDE domain-containing protein n=1 Tax=Araneus ventricosus TaxID=182803 RepID=A0A4Y2D0X3_ARAVE|nr:hypothetical protein AVEN_101802-1 [Araneus ventricosus]
MPSNSELRVIDSKMFTIEPSNMSSGNAVRVCSVLLVVVLLTAELVSAAPYNDYDSDNAGPHRSNFIGLSSTIIIPAQSLDLDPIENIWNVLRRRVMCLNSPPMILPTLKATLQE